MHTEIEELASRADVGSGFLDLADRLERGGLSRSEANEMLAAWGERSLQTLRACRDGLALLHFIALGKIAEQAMEGFRSSQRNRVRRSRTSGPQGEFVTVQVERSDGNPKWLEVAMTALANQRAVVGMNIMPEATETNESIAADDLLEDPEEVSQGGAVPDSPE